MIQTKVLELRDRYTFIPIVAIALSTSEIDNTNNEGENYLLSRAGYRSRAILVTRISGDGNKTWSDPYGWSDRTFKAAHHWLHNNWDDVKSGEVIDVEFILGETDKPKVSEREL